ncbi:hypothetical protein [Levilactobacillus namurensis]|uniref:hypothetical protein n=1 Tax=Levilactobacillus namurensis TaxID=380393 RepID=UPI00222E60BF|nr:hypothetical protein [Levilactobacillus namurensis]MCW3777933.1 hypothetical protein [Levilactobacillus namurensis]MDT7018282.1 hypothetical protein [Levilactobacillus namurensis]WNN64731.1 hypothetical protein RIN67_08395 [Levilactobacillus namurensis]
MQMIASANEYGADIEPKNGKWLTIPTENVPKGAKARDIEGLFRPKDKNILAVSDGKGGLIPMFYLAKKVHIPERSFIRSTFDENVDDWVEYLVDQVIELGMGDSGITARKIMESLGNRIQRSIVQKIRSIESPANSPITIARKGSNSPLEDTGHLIDAVRYKVVNV